MSEVRRVDLFFLTHVCLAYQIGCYLLDGLLENSQAQHDIKPHIAQCYRISYNCCIIIPSNTSTIWLYTSGRLFTSQAVRIENRLGCPRLSVRLCCISITSGFCFGPLVVLNSYHRRFLFRTACGLITILIFFFFTKI
jgi:hypothetical protein